MENLRDITIDLFSIMEEKEKSIKEHEKMLQRMKAMGAVIPKYDPTDDIPALCMFNLFMLMYRQLWIHADDDSRKETFIELMDNLRDEIEEGNNKCNVWEDRRSCVPYGPDLEFWDKNIGFYRALFKITDVMFPFGDSTGFFFDIDDAPWRYSNMCNRLIRIRMLSLS